MRNAKSLLAAAILATLGTASAVGQTPAPTGAPATAEAAAPLPPGHADDGQAIFKKCQACHTIGPMAKNSVGPVLNGIIGRKAGTYPGYTYSDANKNSGVTWNEMTLADYLPEPKAFIPNTKMSFAGLKNPQDVADVIAFLKQFDAQGNKTPPS